MDFVKPASDSKTHVKVVYYAGQTRFIDTRALALTRYKSPISSLTTRLLEACFASLSTLLVASIPFPFSTYMPFDPAVVSHGPVSSETGCSSLSVQPAPLPWLSSTFDVPIHNKAALVPVPFTSTQSITPASSLASKLSAH